MGAVCKSGLQPVRNTHHLSRDVIGAALKTLGLGYNSSAADLRRCGLTEEDLRLRVQRFVKQASGAVCGRVGHG